MGDPHFPAGGFLDVGAPGAGPAAGGEVRGSPVAHRGGVVGVHDRRLAPRGGAHVVAQHEHPAQQPGEQPPPRVNGDQVSPRRGGVQPADPHRGRLRARHRGPCGARRIAAASTLRGTVRTSALRLAAGDGVEGQQRLGSSGGQARLARPGEQSRLPDTGRAGRRAGTDRPGGRTGTGGHIRLVGAAGQSRLAGVGGHAPLAGAGLQARPGGAGRKARPGGARTTARLAVAGGDPLVGAKQSPWGAYPVRVVVVLEVVQALA